MRIDKFLSHLKYCSRKETNVFLKTHTILVNQKRILDVAYNLNPDVEDIYINGEKIFYQYPIHLAIYKPIGYLSANHDTLHPCIVELIKEPYSRFDFSIAGRLDLDAEGLLILTTDGSFVHEITHPHAHLLKTYLVTLNRPFSNTLELQEGLWIKDGKNRVYEAKAVNLSTYSNQVKLSIHTGRFHQVKRMFQALDYEVLNLKRIEIGKLQLGDLSPGEYKAFRKEDVYD